MSAARLRDGGLSVALPRGWDGQIRRRGDRDRAAAERGDEDGVVLHAANFALPAVRGDFGSGAVERMGAPHVLVCLLEYGADDADSELFRHRGVPRLDPSQFSPSAMQRTIAGMGGAQVFFSAADRAFCLYVVVGSYRARGPLVREADAVVATLEFD